jgi:prepilin-type N-terminal cleavage/methylation domain-containing protein
MSRQEGVSLLEMLIALSIVALLTAAALPSFAEWRRGAHSREAARAIASSLRQARSLAIARNRECRVEFDLDGRRLRLAQGNKPFGSSLFTPLLADGSVADVALWPNLSAVGWVELAGDIQLRRNDDCAGTTDVKLEFNPNGTAKSGYICVADPGPVTSEVRFKVGVSSSTTGRVRID